MNERFDQMLQALQSGAPLTGFSKEEVFSCADPRLASGHWKKDWTQRILNALADRGEFLTWSEWDGPFGACETPLGGLPRDPLQCIINVRGWVCTDLTKELAPAHSGWPKRPERQAVLKAATNEDNIRFWHYCYENDTRNARQMWETMDVDVDIDTLYLRKGSMDQPHSPLTIAIKLRHTETVQFLLEAGANPDIRIENFPLPLHKAAASKQDPVVKQLCTALLRYYDDDPFALYNALPRGLHNLPCSLAALNYVNDLSAIANYGIREKLSERLIHVPTLDALITPVDGCSLFRRTVLFKRAADALEALRDKGGKPTKELMWEKRPDETFSTIELIAQQRALAQLFTVENCTHNIRDMHLCWSLLAQAVQKQLDGQNNRPSITAVMREANIQSAKGIRKGRG